MTKLGKKKGDPASVTVSLDDVPRIVKIPIELSKLLEKNKTAQETYNKLAYTHRKEYAQWVGGAKKPATRQQRANKALDMILAKRKRR